MQVVEHEHDGCRRSRRFEQRGGGFEEAIALDVLVGLRIDVSLVRTDGIGKAPEELRREASDLPAVFRDVRTEIVHGAMQDEVPHCFGERLVGHTEVFIATPEQHDRSIGEGIERDLGRQAGLPDPRLTTDERELPLPGHRSLPCRLEPLALDLTADEHQAIDLGQSGGERHLIAMLGLPGELACTHGFVETFQLEGAERVEHVAAARPGECAEHVRDEDLRAVSALAQPLCDDDRRTEIVVLLRRHLADVDADA